MLIFNTVQSYRHKEMNFSQSHREAHWQASGCFLKAFSGTRQTCAIVSARKHCLCVAGRQRNHLTIRLVHTKLSSSSRLVQTVSYCPIYGKCTYRESHVLYTTPLLLPLPPHDFASLLTENTEVIVRELSYAPITSLICEQQHSYILCLLTLTSDCLCLIDIDSSAQGCHPSSSPFSSGSSPPSY